MKIISKVAGAACVVALVASSATAGDVSPGQVESDVYTAETKPAGSLGGSGALIALGALLLLGAAAGGGGSSNGTTSGTN